MKLKLLPVLGITTLLVASLALASAPTANGEFNLDALNDQVQNHEARLGAVEQKVDATQAQVEQNAVTIRAVVAPQTVPSEPVAPVEAPAVTEAPTPAPTITGTVRTVQVGNGGLMTLCKYTYSDGSADTKTFGGEVDC